MVLIAIIYAFRLFDLQINDSRYKESADTNAFLRKTVYPSRGLIYDRNGQLVVFNQPAYDVMLVPRDVTTFDTIDFCNTLGITVETLRQRFEDMRDRHLNPGYSSYTPQVLMTHLSAQDYGRLQEKLYKFPGIFIQNAYCVNTTPQVPQTSWATSAKSTHKTLQTTLLCRRRLYRRPRR